MKSVFKSALLAFLLAALFFIQTSSQGYVMTFPDGIDGWTLADDSPGDSSILWSSSESYEGGSGSLVTRNYAIAEFELSYTLKEGDYFKCAYKAQTGWTSYFKAYLILDTGTVLTMFEDGLLTTPDWVYKSIKVFNNGSRVVKIRLMGGRSTKSFDVFWDNIELGSWSPYTPNDDCINDDPELERPEMWFDIGDPDWDDGAIILDYGEGITQSLDLELVMTHIVEITYTLDYSPEIGVMLPFTVTLGKLTQRVDLAPSRPWIPHLADFRNYVYFGVATTGTYTLTVQRADDSDASVYLQWVCVGSTVCVNHDELMRQSHEWLEIGTPSWLTNPITIAMQGLVELTSGEGVAQDVSLSEGVYQIQTVITGVGVSYLWLGVDAAGINKKVVSDTLDWEFVAMSDGKYQIQVRNTGQPTITLDYVCVRPVAKTLCTFNDYSFDSNAWIGTGNVTFWTGRVDLGCGGFVEQDVYLTKGSHIISVTASAAFLVTGLGITPYYEGGLLTMYWEGMHQAIGAYSIDIPGGILSDTTSFTATINIPLDGYYSFRLWNRDNCHDSGLLGSKKDGKITVYEICLPQDMAQVGPPGGVGECVFVRDSAMAGWGWKDDGDVDWTGTAAQLSIGGSVSQSINISSTAPITQLVAYVVARAAAGSQLRVSLVDSYTFNISRTLESEFVAFTATLSYSRASNYVLYAVSGDIEVEFACLYRPGEVPGPWRGGADGDPVCIQPLSLDWGNLTWDIIDTVSKILKFIWEWIQFFWCEVVAWLARIWFRLGRFVGGMVMDMGDWLNDLRVEVTNWPVVVMMFDLLLFAAWLPSRLLSLVIKIMSPFVWAWQFSSTLVVSIFEHLANPSSVQPLELGQFESGFSFIQGVFSNSPLSALILIVNAILWFIFVVWAIKQFSESNT